MTGDVSLRRSSTRRSPSTPGSAATITKQDWPDVGGVFSWLSGFLVWLAIGFSAFVLGALLLLIAPRAADALYGAGAGADRADDRDRHRDPDRAAGRRLPRRDHPARLTAGDRHRPGAAPLGAVAYVAAAWALGRAIVKPPRQRMLSFLAGLAILRVAALVPILGILVGLAALVFGLGLIGAAIGAAREPADPARCSKPGQLSTGSRG